MIDQIELNDLNSRVGSHGGDLNRIGTSKFLQNYFSNFAMRYHLSRSTRTFLGIPSITIARSFMTVTLGRYAYL